MGLILKVRIRELGCMGKEFAIGIEKTRWLAQRPEWHLSGCEGRVWCGVLGTGGCWKTQGAGGLGSLLEQRQVRWVRYKHFADHLGNVLAFGFAISQPFESSLNSETFQSGSESLVRVQVGILVTLRWFLSWLLFLSKDNNLNSLSPALVDHRVWRKAS